METQERSKMLGTMEMGRLVPKVSIPIMISMMVQALYNVVDGIFVAKYSAAALTAVSLAYPIQMLMIAVSTGLGVGFNSLISRKLGEKRAEEARDAAKNGMFTELCGYALFLVFGLLFAKPFFNLFTDDLELQALGGEYLSIVCIFSFGLFFGICFERMMQATGNTVLSMVTGPGGNYQYYSGSHYDLRSAGLPSYGHCGRGHRYRHRPDRRHDAWSRAQSGEKRGIAAAFEGLPPQ